MGVPTFGAESNILNFMPNYAFNSVFKEKGEDPVHVLSGTLHATILKKSLVNTPTLYSPSSLEILSKHRWITFPRLPDCPPH